MRKNRKIRTAASLAVTVVLSAAMFLLFFSIELLIGYFSPRTFQESLRLGDYAVEMEKELLSKQKELFAAHGLPESLVEDIWGNSKSYMAFYQYLDVGEVKEGGYRFGQQEILEAYLAEQNADETEGVKKAIEIVSKEAEAICSRYIYPPFVRIYRQYVREKKPELTALAAVSAVISALCILLLFRWHHSRHHALYYITGSLFTAAVWNAAGTAAVRIGEKSFGTGTGTAYYQTFLEIFKTRGISAWYVVSIVAAAVGVLLFAVSMHMRKR